MDRLIVERKLDSLRRCLTRIRQRCPDDVETLAGNPDLQDIVVLNLSRAVQICVDLAMHMLSGMDKPAPDTTATNDTPRRPRRQRSDAIMSVLQRPLEARLDTPEIAQLKALARHYIWWKNAG